MIAKKLYYLAHPYTGDIALNLKESIKFTNRLMDLGYYIFNPLTHSHYLDIVKTRDPNFWYQFDLEILKRCDGIILSGCWVTSKGCLLELEYARLLNIEILNYDDLIKPL